VNLGIGIRRWLQLLAPGIEGVAATENACWASPFPYDGRKKIRTLDQ